PAAAPSPRERRLDRLRLGDVLRRLPGRGELAAGGARQAAHLRDDRQCRRPLEDDPLLASSAVTGGAEVVVEHVRKSFEDGRIRALEDVSLELARGELVALTGPSGCGKSTLLNLIGALDRPDSGRISVDGRELNRQADATEYRAATVGFVFQSHNL